MGYRTGLDGLVPAEIGQLIQSMEKHVGGKGVVAFADDLQEAASTVCPPHMNCGIDTHSTKGGHGFFIIIVVVIVVSAITGYVAGLCAAKRSNRRSTKGGHGYG